jgi:hypothetical protein
MKCTWAAELAKIKKMHLDLDCMELTAQEILHELMHGYAFDNCNEGKYRMLWFWFTFSPAKMGIIPVLTIKIVVTLKEILPVNNL